jgi:hypothetical protein
MVSLWAGLFNLLGISGHFCGPEGCQAICRRRVFVRDLSAPIHFEAREVEFAKDAAVVINGLCAI